VNDWISDRLAAMLVPLQGIPDAVATAAAGR
jgi:hypothetical protein